MREKNFRKPRVRELLETRGIELPKKINEKFILKLIDSGILIPVGSSYKGAVEFIDNLNFSDRSFALFPSKFKVSKEESDYGIKSLEALVKIDSQQTLRHISKGKDIPFSLTKEFAEQHRIWPYTLIRQAIKYMDVEKPPVGFYWVGTDNHFRATTWIRAVAGAEMQVMKGKGDFKGEVIDKRPYARNLKVRVSSRTEEGEKYEFTLTRLPMHKRGDIRQYSDWINLGHDSADPDASYRGEEHERRKHPVCFWSASTIFSFYDAMSFVRQHPRWMQFRINPFPIPTNEKMIDFVDKLRLKSLILNEENGKLKLEILSKTVIDEVIGARTILSYDNCWHHWGKKNLSYLYRPQKS